LSRAPDRLSGTSRHNSLLLCFVPIAIALAFGFLIGRTTAPSPAVRAAAHANASAARTRAGIPIDFPRSRAGAAGAVAAYQRAFASPSILRASVMRERIEAVATSTYAKTMLTANSPGRERIAAGPIGRDLASGLKTLYSAVPIGYRVESYSPWRARILTWGFTLLGGATVEPAAYFGLAHTELAWSEGQWKIAETRAGFGPTPRLATPPGPLGAYDVMSIAAQLKSYELAP